MLVAMHPYGLEETLEISRTEFESIVRDGTCVEEDTVEYLPTEAVAQGVSREHDMMKSFPVCQAVPRAEVTGKVWSTRWCYRRHGPKQVLLQCHSCTRGHESFVGVPLSTDLTFLLCDISVAFVSTCLRAIQCAWSHLRVSTNTTTWCGV